MAMAAEALELLETVHALMEGYEAGGRLAEVTTKCQQGDYAGAADDLAEYLAEKALPPGVLPALAQLRQALDLLRLVANSEHADTSVQAQATGFSYGEPNYSEAVFADTTYADTAYADANYGEGTGGGATYSDPSYSHANYGDASYGEASESSESPTE